MCFAMNSHGFWLSYSFICIVVAFVVKNIIINYSFVVRLAFVCSVYAYCAATCLVYLLYNICICIYVIQTNTLQRIQHAYLATGRAINHNLTFVNNVNNGAKLASVFAIVDPRNAANFYKSSVYLYIYICVCVWLCVCVCVYVCMFDVNYIVIGCMCFWMLVNVSDISNHV